MTDVTQNVRALVEPLVRPHGIEVVDVEHGPGLLRIYLDHEDPARHIDLDTITVFSEQISDLLDLHDPIPGGRYTLEVSSPGLERPLHTREQFRRYANTPEPTIVNIKTKPHVEGERRFTGPLTEATDTHVTVGDRILAYTDIDRAKTVFEWGPTPKHSTKPKTTTKTKPKKATTP
jgi:ribosome maturation factor RimP